MSDMPTPIQCEVCKKEIDEIAGVDGYFIGNYPIILHPHCYKYLADKAWKYDELCD